MTIVACEIPINDYWCGREIPTHPKGNIFRFLTKRQHWDPVEKRVRAMLRFKLTREQYEYWLAEWQHTKRGAL